MVNYFLKMLSVGQRASPLCLVVFLFLTTVAAQDDYSREIEKLKPNLYLRFDDKVDLTPNFLNMVRPLEWPPPSDEQ